MAPNFLRRTGGDRSRLKRRRGALHRDSLLSFLTGSTLRRLSACVLYLCVAYSYVCMNRCFPMCACFTCSFDCVFPVCLYMCVRVSIVFLCLLQCALVNMLTLRICAPNLNVSSHMFFCRCISVYCLFRSRFYVCVTMHISTLLSAIACDCSVHLLVRLCFDKGFVGRSVGVCFITSVRLNACVCIWMCLHVFELSCVCLGACDLMCLYVLVCVCSLSEYASQQMHV